MDDLYETAARPTEAEELVEALKSATDSIGKRLEKIEAKLGGLVSIADATGLRLSVPTWRNLRRLLSGREDLEPMDASSASMSVFREILHVPQKLASQLARSFFRTTPSDEELLRIEGMTPELLEKLKRYFHWSDEG